MSKALKKIGTVLAVAALTFATAGAFAPVGAGILGASFTALGTIAGIGATIASMGSQALAKPPPARGSVTQLIVDPNAPQPYVMGATYFAGILRHRAGYGGTVDDVPNPYLFDAVVYSGGGPVQSISPRVDFAAVGSWFSGYLATDTQTGACPEANALSASYSTPTGWGASSKLSGQAAIGWNFKFDKKGKKFASGLPSTGAYLEGVKVYDPRLDSSFPGGSGSCTLGTESTYVYSDNPALHAGTYAYGRYQNGKRTFGIGIPADGIDWAKVASWANLCEANDWTISGVIFEPSDRWTNLRDICAAGGGEPIPGPVLSFRWPDAAVPLATVTEADLASDDCSVCPMQSYRDRVNTVKPRYRSAAHNWELVQASAVSVAGYVSEDGEERAVEWPFNLIKDVDQAAQLAAYRLVDARELFPIELHCKPSLRGYRPGDCLHLDLPMLGLDHDAIILRRELDPATMTVRLTLRSETEEKHAFALGETGVAPATPTLVQTPEERDETAAGGADRQVAIELVGSRNYPADYAGTVLSALLPDTIVPQVLLGGADIRTADEVSYTLSASGVAASVNNTPGSADKGKITVTAVNATSGWIDLTVTVAGVTYPVKRIVVQRLDGLPPGFGGPGSKIASDNAFATLASTSFTAITDVLTVTLAGGENLYGTAPLSYITTDAASIAVDAKWQHSPAGAGTWTDFDTAISGDPATFATGPYGEPLYGYGNGSFTQSESGLSAGDYDVRLVAKNDVAGTVYFTGTATVEAKV